MRLMLLMKAISRVTRRVANMQETISTILTEAKELFKCEGFYFYIKDNIEKVSMLSQLAQKKVSHSKYKEQQSHQ